MTYYYHIPQFCLPDRSGNFRYRIFFFGGKDDTGDGAPEGLPLICRFSYLTLPLLEGEVKAW
jgi:hypothetical protein